MFYYGYQNKQGNIFFMAPYIRKMLKCKKQVIWSRGIISQASNYAKTKSEKRSLSQDLLESMTSK